MTTYLEVAVNVPQVSGTFHYHLPSDWEEPITPGCLVTIPFGKQTVQGVVLEISERYLASSIWDWVTTGSGSSKSNIGLVCGTAESSEISSTTPWTV